MPFGAAAVLTVASAEIDGLRAVKRFTLKRWYAGKGTHLVCERGKNDAAKS